MLLSGIFLESVHTEEKLSWAMKGTAFPERSGREVFHHQASDQGPWTELSPLFVSLYRTKPN